VAYGRGEHGYRGATVLYFDKAPRRRLAAATEMAESGGFPAEMWTDLYSIHQQASSAKDCRI